jgi:hypothetical protein
MVLAILLKTKNMKSKISLLILGGGLLLLGACTKEGARGPQGATGATGADGNANVIGSNPVTITWETADSTLSATLTDADITQDVVDNGLVEVYKEYNDGSWTNLPDVNGINSTVFNFYAGGLTLYDQNADGTLPANPGNQTFRIVIIPSSQRKANPNVNWSSYNAVKALVTKQTTVTIAPVAKR